MSYNPGTATEPVKVGEGRYCIDSFRGELKTYEVDTVKGTCSCPHWVSRLSQQEHAVCKHLQACYALEAAAPRPTALDRIDPTPTPLTPEQQSEIKRLFSPTQWEILVATCTEEELQAAIRQAREARKGATKLERAQAVAETLPDAELKKYAAEKLGTPAGAACLLTLARRQAERQRDWADWPWLDNEPANLREAEKAAERQPRPIPPGVMDLLAGATEAEKARALAIYR